MAKKNYKETSFVVTLTYHAWHTTFRVECKFKKLWKYIDGSIILPGLDYQQTTQKAITTIFDLTARIAKTESNSNCLVNKTALEVLLKKKKIYEVGLKQDKKRCFMSVDKIHQVIVFELSDLKDMVYTLDQKYSASNITRLCQLLLDCQTVNMQKNIEVIEKYKSILNFSEEICIQKPKLAFQDKYLINFFLASKPPTYGSIIDDLNMRYLWTLEGTVCAFCTKKTELTKLNVIKEKNAYFVAQGRFQKGQESQREADASIISQTADRDYTVPGYSSRHAINCNYFKKYDH